MIDMVSSGMGASRQLESVAPKALEGDYAPGFMAAHLRKDIALALQTAGDYGLSLPATETSLNLVHMLCEVGGTFMGTQALSLLYADEETCAAAGLDWSLLPDDDEPHHHHHHHH
jgi:3-hydroxyisobutyrate dehydrogenase